MAKKKSYTFPIETINFHLNFNYFFEKRPNKNENYKKKKNKL